MMSFGAKYSSAGKLAALFILMVLISPSLTALVATDDCCDEATCCEYDSCACNCHSVAGLVSIPDYSHAINMVSYFGTPSPTLPTEDHPWLDERPPRLNA